MHRPLEGPGPTFTVLTTTYDRAHTLPWVYESLKRQTFGDFEWLIVDDGSSDGTDTLVRGWAEEAVFPIVYIGQQNRGKHAAFNRGIREARGTLTLNWDSDDRAVPEALERLWHHWRAIPDETRAGYSGITVLCQDEEGRIIGSEFPGEVFDSTPVEMTTRFGMRGDKWGFHRTDVLRAFPFPEIEGERFIPEGIVWNRIARRYKMRYVNEALKIVTYHESGLSADSLGVRARNPRSARLVYREMLGWQLPPTWLARTLVNYLRFSLHANVGAGAAAMESGHRLAALLLLPVGYVVYWNDRRRLGRRRRGQVRPERNPTAHQ